MKILNVLALTLSAGALFAQAPEQELDGRFQIFAEVSRPVAITVVNNTPPLQNEPSKQTGIGIRFLGEIATAPNWYYEVGGKGSSYSEFTLNGNIGNGTLLDLTSVKVTTSYWSLGGAYMFHPVEALSLGAHLEARGEAINASGPVLQNLSGTGWTTLGNVSSSTTYLRPWIRVSADLSFHIGDWHPYVGVDFSGAITRTQQTEFVSLDLIDNRTLKSLAPRFAAAFYVGARF